MQSVNLINLLEDCVPKRHKPLTFLHLKPLDCKLFYDILKSVVTNQLISNIKLWSFVKILSNERNSNNLYNDFKFFRKASSN